METFWQIRVELKSPVQLGTWLPGRVGEATDVEREQANRPGPQAHSGKLAGKFTSKS